MENAVQALKMGAAVLVFVIAIGTSFYMFGLAKDTADSIVLMRDKQAYLDSAELKNQMYVDSNDIPQVTTNGDRYVNIDDVISTIYRYADEKYAVTIIDSSGNIKARFDSSIESIVQNSSYKITTANWDNLATQIQNNLQNKYKIPTGFNGSKLKELYELKINLESGTTKTICGAPWLGNSEEIKKRINKDIGRWNIYIQ